MIEGKKKDSLRVLPNLLMQIYAFICQSIEFPTENKTDNTCFRNLHKDVLNKLKYINYLLCEHSNNVNVCH